MKVFASVAMASFLPLTPSAFASQSFKTTAGKPLIARFHIPSAGGTWKEVAEPTQQVKMIEVCGRGATKLSEAVLWMPHHGHGSSPTTISAQGAGCARISKVALIMAGEWELRLRFQDQDRATINLNIAR